MRIKAVGHGYACKVYDVELTAAENALPDADLITACDNGGFENKRVCHFGGEVVRQICNAGTFNARVKVYID